MRLIDRIGNIHHYISWTSPPRRDAYRGVPEYAGGSTECVICLGAVEKGETMRVLPACGHVFHVPCVDTWLTFISSYPVCRAGVEPPSGAVPCVQEKPQDAVKEEAGVCSAPVLPIGASLMKKMLGRERPRRWCGGRRSPAPRELDLD
jgi:hypothetical protein